MMPHIRINDVMHLLSIPARVTVEYLKTYSILLPQLLQDSGNEDEGEDGDADDGSYDQSNGEGEGVGVSDLFDALSEISMNTEEFLEKEEGD